MARLQWTLRACDQLRFNNALPLSDARAAMYFFDNKFRGNATNTLLQLDQLRRISLIHPIFRQQRERFIFAQILCTPSLNVACRMVIS